LCTTPYKKIQFIKSAKKIQQIIFSDISRQKRKIQKSQKCKISNSFFLIFQGKSGKSKNHKNAKSAIIFFRYFKAKAENQPFTNSNDLIKNPLRL
jgi:hypothetical protein